MPAKTPLQAKLETHGKAGEFELKTQAAGLNNVDNGDYSQVEETDPSEEQFELFAIDTEPTPLDLSSLAPPPDSEEEDDGVGHQTEQTLPSTGMNREGRRRLILMERQRETIQKQLRVPVGSSERAAEVEAALARWTRDRDTKTARRLEKKKARRAKSTQIVRKKNSEVLSGSKPSNPSKKQLVRKERKAKSKRVQKSRA